MLLRIDDAVDGDAPSERIARIPTIEGPEEVAVHRSQIQGNQIEVGYIGQKPNGEVVLVELPRETLRGKWRVWVSHKDLQPTRESAAVHRPLPDSTN